MLVEEYRAGDVCALQMREKVQRDSINYFPPNAHRACRIGFFAELGFLFPQFPYVAHSRGCSAEDMENNVRCVQNSKELREGVAGLVSRCVEMANLMIGGKLPECDLVRGGRKAHQLDVRAQI